MMREILHLTSSLYDRNSFSAAVSLHHLVQSLSSLVFVILFSLCHLVQPLSSCLLSVDCLASVILLGLYHLVQSVLFSFCHLVQSVILFGLCHCVQSLFRLCHLVQSVILFSLCHLVQALSSCSVSVILFSLSQFLCTSVSDSFKRCIMLRNSETWPF